MSSEQKIVSAPSASAAQKTITTNNKSYRLPCESTLFNACKLSITEDKPIMMDYWTTSLDKTAVIGVRENSEKLLVKSSEEYTSPISKFYKVGTEYIVVTENSIYIIANDIPQRRIS
jgi:hypothetical protein